MKPINSVEELIKEIESGNHDFFLSGGIWRSSKHIEYNDGLFYVYNEIDDTEQELTAKQLFDEDYTNIGIGMEKGKFYAY